jgi:hypothetical protein
MTGIREIPGSRYNEALEKVVGFCRTTPETVYKPKDFVKILRLDVPPIGLQASLRLRHKEVGLLRIYDQHYEPHYGYSRVCGSGECFSSWCSKDAQSVSCRTEGGNENLKFYK